MAQSPRDMTDQDYIDLYRYLYPFQGDPLLWVHLNTDYPYTLQGLPLSTHRSCRLGKGRYPFVLQPGMSVINQENCSPLPVALARGDRFT